MSAKTPPGPAPALDRLLIGTDFSAAAAEVAAWAAERLAPEAELLLVHVTDVPYPPPILRRGLPSREELVAKAVADAEERMAAAAEALPRLPVETRVEVGRAAERLIALVGEREVDMVVVGTHGDQGLWANLGSTAEALLRASPVPVLLARSPERAPLGHLLVAVDDSEEARAALAWTAFLAKATGARVTALHVLSAATLGHMRRVSSEPAARQIESEARTGVVRWLEDQVEAAGVPAERREVRVEVGDPRLEILAVAARLGADLVVLGSRGSGGAGLFGLGSLAAAVTRTRVRPILVVPPPGR